MQQAQGHSNVGAQLVPPERALKGQAGQERPGAVARCKGPCQGGEASGQIACSTQHTSQRATALRGQGRAAHQLQLVQPGCTAWSARMQAVTRWGSNIARCNCPWYRASLLRGEIELTTVMSLWLPHCLRQMAGSRGSALSMSRGGGLVVLGGFARRDAVVKLSVPAASQL
jgi:hypothetical protein